LFAYRVYKQQKHAHTSRPVSWTARTSTDGCASRVILYLEHFAKSDYTMTTGMDNVKNVQYVRQKCYNIQKALQAHNCGVHAVLYESRLRSSTGTKFEK